MDLRQLETRGWIRAPKDAGIAAWVAAAQGPAQDVLADPDLRAEWLQCQGTWFVGVDALPTEPDGSIAGTALKGDVIDALSPLPPLHPAQLSVTYPGYPKPRAGESDANFAYRLKRDAAHVDGITAEGPDKRRFITEPHAFILGLPLNDASPEASPLVVWEGSQAIMREALTEALAQHDPKYWPNVDVTEAYQAARRVVFEQCDRVTVPARPGEAVLVHRLALHGIAPWKEGASAQDSARMIAYFRPILAAGIAAWLR